MTRTGAKLGAWGALGFVAFATLSPIGLRPTLPDHPNVEHVGAFGAIGLLLGLAHPRRPLSAFLLVIAVAVSLEAAQHFVSGRHGRLSDLAMKAAGGGVGLAAAAAANGMLRRHG